MSRKIFSLIPLLALLLILPSCKLFKHKKSKKEKQAAAAQLQKIDSLNAALKTAVESIDTNADVEAEILNFKPIWSKRIDLNTLSAKAKMHYENADKNFDFVANFRIRKDSIIWVSVSVAGLLQVARAVITPDSFKAILYTEKEAYQGPISDANKFLPEGIDFYSLQNLLLGDPILNNLIPSAIKKETATIAVRSTNDNYVELATYNLQDSSMLSSQVLAQKEDNKSLSQVLRNFIKIEKYWLSTERTINVQAAESKMLIDMSLSNIEINSAMNFPFSIPKNYTLK